MKRKYLYLLLALVLFVLPLALSGCTDADEPKEEAGQEQDGETENQQGEEEQNNQEQANEEQVSPEMRRELARVRAAARLAEEKITIMFEKYTPEGSEEEILVAKDNYTSTESMKELLSTVYTAEMADQIIEEYVVVEEVPGKGSIPVLKQPENYPTITGYQFTDADEVVVEGEEATITLKGGDTPVTYRLTKVGEEWVVTAKE